MEKKSAQTHAKRQPTHTDNVRRGDNMTHPNFHNFPGTASMFLAPISTNTVGLKYLLSLDFSHEMK